MNILSLSNMKINVWHLSEKYFLATRPHKQELHIIFSQKPRSCCCLRESVKSQSKGLNRLGCRGKEKGRQKDVHIVSSLEELSKS